VGPATYIARWVTPTIARFAPRSAKEVRVICPGHRAGEHALVDGARRGVLPSIPEEADLRIQSERLRALARAREWDQFHTPKNLAMAIAVEAAELMEPLQWLTLDEAERLKDDTEARTDRLGDRRRGDLTDPAGRRARDRPRAANARKIDRNEQRFPVEGVRGRSRMPGV
jgi:hypothetical protein